jgi:16S rRNA (cytosine967-C5)-methyltransferase
VPQTARQIAFQALKHIHRGAFADVALDRALNQSDLPPRDRHLTTELVYGSLRRQRTLDAIVTHLATKPAAKQPPDLRLILHLGLYQLRYLDHIPAAAAINTTVDLAKQNGLSGLSGFVNGLLRQYDRAPDQALPTVTDPIAQIGQTHSFPDWIVAVYNNQFGPSATANLCNWLNQPPAIDLRINPLKTTIDAVIKQFNQAEINVEPLPYVTHGLRLTQHVGAIQALPGFYEGHWTVQDASAQLVAELLNPQPGETIVDACAAPGGKTLHIAALMQDQGTVWAVDKTESRLKKIQQNIDRLGLTNIQIKAADSRDIPEFVGLCDRVLVDAPCSGLGTLHRHADARWRQTPESVNELSQIQTAILAQAATWLKPHGTLVYATCTLHPQENEAIVEQFLQTHPQWEIAQPTGQIAALAHPQGWIKLLPSEHQMDGFFMVQFRPPALCPS